MSVLAVVLLMSSAYAASPSLRTIIPRGAQRGTEVSVRFAGNNLQDAQGVLFHGPGIEFVSSEAAEDNKFVCTLRIAPDCRPGRHAMRVRTASGLSNLAIFSVGNLAEMEEAEPNNSSETANAVSLNTTANGTVQNEDVDYFAIELEAGQRLAVESEAIRLGESLFDIKLRLFNAEGHELVAEDDTALMRQDAAFVHTAETAGRYVIAVSEASYGGAGSYRYRLHIGDFPRPLAVSPWGGKPGETVHLTWLGDSGLAAQEIAVPQGAAGSTDAIFPMTEAGVAPTPLPFRLAAFDGVLETEPNDGAETATQGAAPGAFDGVIQAEGDVDWYRFDGTAQQTYDVRVWARELGSPLDPVLVVKGPDGGNVTSNDDGAGMDAYARVTLPADGAYTVGVYDHLRRGGPTYAYRIEVSPVQPSLALQANQNEPAHLTIHRGGRALLLLQADRSEFGGNVDIDGIEGIPDGVELTHAPSFGGGSIVPVLLTASADAPLAASLLAITASQKNEQGEPAIAGGFKQSITLIEGQNQTVFDSYTVKRFAVAVAEPAPFEIEIVPPKAPLVQRAPRKLTVQAKRAEGFTAPIEVEIPWLPNNINAGSTTIPENQDTAEISLQLRDYPPGQAEIIAHASSSGYRVATPFTPLEIQEQWVTFSVGDVSIEQGQTVDVTVAVHQHHPYEGEWEVRMSQLPKGVTTPNQKFTKDTTEVVFPMTAAGDAPETKMDGMILSTAINVNGEDVIHGSPGAKISIYKPLPPELQQPAEPEKPAEEKEEEAPKRRTRFPENTQ